jgi:hypothetical protein
MLKEAQLKYILFCYNLRMVKYMLMYCLRNVDFVLQKLQFGKGSGLFYKFWNQTGHRSVSSVAG